MNILETIVAHKNNEIELKKAVLPQRQLEQFDLFERPTISMSKSLLNSTNGIIAEHKRRSPSKSVINQQLDVSEVARGYQNAGVAAMSVLTDGRFFGGSLEDLIIARSSTDLPLLRKDFIIDPYQVVEAKAFGADAILLIATILNNDRIISLSNLANEIGLEVLMEIHDETELKKALKNGIEMIGINNRNLKNFEVDLETSKTLGNRIPSEFIKISESG